MHSVYDKRLKNTYSKNIFKYIFITLYFIQTFKELMFYKWLPQYIFLEMLVFLPLRAMSPALK